MKKITTVILLTVFSVLASAQNKDDRIDKLTISYYGDSTLLTEKYEINIKKEKIYYITTIINYADIEGEKHRTRIKIKKQKWDDIKPLINRLITLSIDQNNIAKDGNIIYSIVFSQGDKDIGESLFYADQVPSELRKLFDIIRNKE